MKQLIGAIWNLPASLLERVTGRNLTFQKTHNGCGGEWRRRERGGKHFERCSKCGAERGAHDR